MPDQIAHCVISAGNIFLARSRRREREHGSTRKELRWLHRAGTRFEQTQEDARCEDV